MDREKKRYEDIEDVSSFQLKVDNNEWYGNMAIHTVEIPAEDRNTAEVMEVKQKKMENLFRYDVFEKVDVIGQERIGSRWVMKQNNLYVTSCFES